MVGLLNGMDSEDRSTVALGDSKDVGDVQEESNVQNSGTDESQPAAENTDNVDEVEHVKELKSILKQRGQYTFRKVKVDFDLIPKKIPYDENDYTIEIQIIEKEPVKIKSWAAIFAAKKAEAEAEAAAVAEAEEALKKAEEVQKREALKKANKEKLKKLEEQKAPQETGTILPSEPNERQKSTETLNPLDHEVQYIEPESEQQSTSQSLPEQQTENQEPMKEANCQEEIDNNTVPSSMEVTAELPQLCRTAENHELAESIVEDVLNTVVSAEAFFRQNKSREPTEGEQNTEQKDEEESSCTESLATERSEQIQEDHTNDDLEEMSTQEETSVSQSIEDSNAGERLSQDVSHSKGSSTRSDSQGKSSVEDASDSYSDITSVTEALTSLSDGDSSKLVDLQGKQVPKKMLVTAASLVEEIISEVPKVIPEVMPKAAHIEAKNDKSGEESILTLNEALVQESFSTETSLQDPNATIREKTINQETGARKKRRQFKKSENSRIFEHVKRSLESAAPELLETAVGVLEEIEKIVVEKVGPAIQ